MRLDVITDHTESVLNLMMDKAIRECDPRVWSGGCYMVHDGRGGRCSSGRNWAECCIPQVYSKKSKNKMASRLHSIISMNRSTSSPKKRMSNTLIF